MGLEPVVVVLETCDEAVRDAREESWIRKLIADGESLTNCTFSGSVVGYTLTEADKKKISDALKGKPKSEEHRAKLSLARKDKPTSSAYRQACRRRCLGRKMPAESVAKTAAALRGRKRSKETRKKMREAHQRRRMMGELDAIIAGGKTCAKCEVFKPFCEFYAAPAMIDGHESNCKQCRSIAASNRYRKKREKPAGA